MDNNRPPYTLGYLRTFYTDMEKIVDYISNVLQNPEAADKLIDNVHDAIHERLPFADSYEPYHSRRKRRYPYYRIYVGEYIVYYVVIPESSTRSVMEVRRILHRLQDRRRYL